jgi:hypothetical protein
MPRVIPFGLVSVPVTKPFPARQTEKFGMIALQEAQLLSRMEGLFVFIPMEDRE